MILDDYQKRVDELFNQVKTTQRENIIAAERYELVAQVLAGNSIKEVSCNAGINSGQLCQWVKKYKTNGYNGLENLIIGRPRKCPEMKKTCSHQTQKQILYYSD